MRGARHLATLLLMLGAIMLAIPAATLAAGGGGPCASCSQYSDPFGSSTSTSHTTTSPPASTPTATAPAPTATTPTASTPAPTTTSAPAPSATTPGTTAAPPTATTAAPATTSTASKKTLPYTGFDSWEVGAIGAAMLVAGVIARRRAQRS